MEGLHLEYPKSVEQKIKIYQMQQKFFLELDEYIKNKQDLIQSQEKEWMEDGFTPISGEIIKKTFQFVKTILYDFWKSDIHMEIPEILPCPDGSFDINWEMPNYDMLINIPKEEAEQCDFYGRNFDNKQFNIVGKCSIGILKEVIFAWIRKTHHRG